MDPNDTERPDESADAQDGAAPPPPPPPSGAAGPPPPDDGTGPAPQPPLRRRTDDKIIAGVASGLAAYLRVDPALVRIGFVVLLFMGGVGVPLYIAAWLLIPAADEAEAQASQLIDQRGPAFWVGVGLLVLVAFAVADEVIFAGRTNWWPLVLIAAGVALWRVGQKDGERRAAAGGDALQASVAPTVDPSPAAPTARPQEATMRSTTTAVREYTPPPVPGRPAPAPVAYTPPPATPRERSILGRLTIALAFIAAGVTVILDRVSPMIEAGFAEVAAVVLLTVGAGLIVGAWFGRARWLILVGLVLTPLVIVSSLATRFDVPLGSGIGERFVEISSPSEIGSAPLDLAIGSLTIDLTDYTAELPGDPIVADVGAGEIIVLVPPGADVSLVADVGVGELVFFEQRIDGPDISGEFRRAGDGPVIELRLDAGAGSLVVREESGEVSGTSTVFGDSSADALRGSATSTATAATAAPAQEVAP